MGCLKISTYVKFREERKVMSSSSKKSGEHNFVSDIKWDAPKFDSYDKNT